MTDENRSTGRAETDWDRMDLPQLRDLWKALHDAISQQPMETQSEISIAYVMHPLYAKHFPDDHEIYKHELEEN